MISATSQNSLFFKICPWLVSSLKQFEQAKLKGRLGHGWLLCGRKSIGKINLALNISNELLHSNAQTPIIMDAVEAEDAITTRHEMHEYHPDLHWIYLEPDKRDISVDQIRDDIIEPLSLTSYDQGPKIAIIENAEHMNLSASNALLKTLEQPTDNTYLFLTTGNPALLPATIRSRCQVLNVSTPSHSEILPWLSNLDQSVSKIEWLNLLSLSSGLPFQAMKLYHNDFITRDKEYIELLASIFDKNLDPQDLADRWINDDLELALMWFSYNVRKTIHSCLGAGDVNSQEIENHSILSNLLSRLPIKYLFQVHDNIDKIVNGIRTGLNTELALKAMLLQLSTKFAD